MNISDQKLADRQYRAEFVVQFVKRCIAFQVRTIRRNQKLSQKQLANAAFLTQGVVSRAEDPDYGNLTLNTILRIAAGFDLAFTCSFATFGDFVKWKDGMTEAFLVLPRFEEEAGARAIAISRSGSESTATTDSPSPSSQFFGPNQTIEELAAIGGHTATANQAGRQGLCENGTGKKQPGAATFLPHGAEWSYCGHGMEAR